MNIKAILIVLGEPNSTFSEVLLKYFNSKSYKHNKKKIILIGSINLFKEQMKILKRKIQLNEITDVDKSIKKKVNIINVNYNFKNAFDKINKKSNKYIEECFAMAFYLIKKGKIKKFINGPISKKNFLGNKYLGITEYISKKFNIKNNAMLIYNKNLSVSPITTHLPLKFVSKEISRNNIYEKTKLINNFYLKEFNKKPKIAILGLNPHCESVHKFNEDERIIKPAVKLLYKKGFKISGPYSADTFFLKKNRDKFDVVLGMYHDQVLTPIKTLYEYDAINITLGLPFTRITPDHGPNEKMLGKNLSNPLSLLKAINFLDKN